MAKRKINSEEFDVVCEMLYQLTEILLDVGITELRISRKEHEIFWNTENSGQIDPDSLAYFSHVIDGALTHLWEEKTAI